MMPPPASPIYLCDAQIADQLPTMWTHLDTITQAESDHVRPELANFLHHSVCHRPPRLGLVYT